MNAEPNSGQLPELIVLLRGGDAYGSVMISLGLLLTVWGMVNFFFVRNRLVLTLQALLSFLPATFALWGIHTAYVQFAQMAEATVAPKPIEFASMTVLAMGCGFWGIVSTMVPGFVGVLALSKSTARTRP